MLLGAILLALAPGALAGMYGKPVINLDAKTFKQAMSVEHAAVRLLSAYPFTCSARYHSVSGQS